MDRPDTWNLSFTELGTYEGALIYTMALALEWGVVEVGPDEQVAFHGLVIEDGDLVSEGLAIVGSRPDPDSPAWVLSGSTILNTGVLVAANYLIGIIGQIKNGERHG